MRSLVHAFILPAAFFAALPLAAQCNQQCPPQRTISVGATGSVTVDADLAIVHVGYKVYGADAQSVYASATQTSNAIMDALTAKGIAKDAIESTSQALEHTPPFELNPYPVGSADREHHQFEVSQEWTVRVKPDQAASALDTAIRAGANESGWIEWSIADPTQFEAQASAKAIANARTIAQQIASTAGVKLGPLQTANENQQGGMEPRGGPILRMQAVNNNPPLAINSRRIEFKASIFASFAIE